jgi:hypothetical protein
MQCMNQTHPIVHQCVRFEVVQILNHVFFVFLAK